MNLFWELHKDIPREGPGCNESTRQAFLMLRDLPAEPHILDIGCGPGMQTVELAKNCAGKIIGLDTHQPFLDTLASSAGMEGVANRVTTRNGSMFALDFAGESFDIIWSEGAIYIIGFEQGLREWGEYLKPGGYLVVSEISWLRQNPPDEVLQYWQADYPAMSSVSKNIQTIEDTGYTPVAHFILPEKGWWNDYYNPLQERVNLLREKYAGNQEAQTKLDCTEKEMEIYRKYFAYFGYVFYLMKKD